MKVLIAEDEAVSRLLLERTVMKRGYRPQVVQDGHEAWQVLQQPDAPRLVILDWMMPGMDGPQICQAVRNNSRSDYTYIILITAKSGRDDIVRGLEAGADDYIVKPVDEDELASRLRVGQRIIELEQMLRKWGQELERRVQERTSQLQVQTCRAVAASRAKSEFLANMSHELRTPLNAIIGFADVLGEQIYGPLNPQQRQCIEDILDSGRHLLSLVNDILDLTKIEAGKMQVDWSSVDLQGLLDRAVRMFRKQASQKSIRLSSELDERVSRINGDQRQIKQIVYNLLSNALKFTPAGGQVTLRTRTDRDAVVLCVEDTGAGIPPEKRDKIFDYFYQADCSVTKNQQGAGLGLALVRNFAELHGGKVWVESQLGRGSRFFVRLPYNSAQPNGKRCQESSDECPAAETAHGGTDQERGGRHSARPQRADYASSATAQC